MTNPFNWIIEKGRYLNDLIWRTSLSDISRGKSFVFRQLRIIVLAARGFMNDRVQLRASALTLYTLLSIVPFAAIAFGIAKGFALDQKLQELLTREFQNLPGGTRQVKGLNRRSYLNNIRWDIKYRQ